MRVRGGVCDGEGVEYVRVRVRGGVCDGEGVEYVRVRGWSM